ncbi:hypothetical protein VNO77_19692 [Canavalia gladiata]|uniref:Uncharacterized protein n=1 Tax=Canavalia gladiata TaxID=3824 RepID=A0AAN9QKN9_CANGL
MQGPCKSGLLDESCDEILAFISHILPRFPSVAHELVLSQRTPYMFATKLRDFSTRWTNGVNVKHAPSWLSREPRWSESNELMEYIDLNGVRTIAKKCCTSRDQ